MESLKSSKGHKSSDKKDDVSDELFTVKTILACKEEKGIKRYKVRWDGFSKEHDSWEPAEHLQDCRDVIKDFHRKETQRAEERAKKKEESKWRGYAPFPSNEPFDTVKDKFWDNLNDGKLQLDSSDMFSKIKTMGRSSRPKSFAKMFGRKDEQDVSNTANTSSKPSGDDKKKGGENKKALVRTKSAESLKRKVPKESKIARQQSLSKNTDAKGVGRGARNLLDTRQRVRAARQPPGVGGHRDRVKRLARRSAPNPAPISSLGYQPSSDSSGPSSPDLPHQLSVSAPESGLKVDDSIDLGTAPVSTASAEDTFDADATRSMLDESEDEAAVATTQKPPNVSPAKSKEMEDPDTSDVFKDLEDMLEDEQTASEVAGATSQDVQEAGTPVCPVSTSSPMSPAKLETSSHVVSSDDCREASSTSMINSTSIHKAMSRTAAVGVIRTHSTSGSSVLPDQPPAPQSANASIGPDRSDDSLNPLSSKTGSVVLINDCRKAAEEERRQQDEIDHKFLTAVKEGERATALSMIYSNATPNISRPDHDGMTPLMHAVMQTAAEECSDKQVAWDMVEMLLLEGANVNDQDSNGKTALMMASLTAHTPIIRMLIEHHAFVNLRDNPGETALHKAIRSRRHRSLKELLEAGADWAQTSPVTGHGTPEDLAQGLGEPACISVLNNHCFRIQQVFKSEVEGTLQNVASIQYTLLPVRCIPLREAENYTLHFECSNIQYLPGLTNVLFIGHARFTADECFCRFQGACAVRRVWLNGQQLVSITSEEGVNFIMSFSPLKQGRNVLKFDTVSAPNSQLKLLVAGFKITTPV